MNRRLAINVDEYRNGYGVVGMNEFDVVLDEVHEEYLETLKAIETWIKSEIIDELERRTSDASHS